MMEYLICTKCLNDDEEFNRIIDKISKEKFDHGSGLIETVLNARAVELFGQNRNYLVERERIKPDYERINTELGEMRRNQNKLDKALTLSIAALKTWTTTHINLRETVNRKQPLSVTMLAAKVKEIWAVLEPAETE